MTLGGSEKNSEKCKYGFLKGSGKDMNISFLTCFSRFHIAERIVEESRKVG